MISPIRTLRLALLVIAAVMVLFSPAAAHSLEEVDQNLRDKEQYFQPVGNEAPSFTLQDADGRVVGLDILRGKVAS